jgi:pyruvate formate lyase activating enzyme
MAPPIGGYIPTSFLDYPGCTAAVIFFTGCQFRCPFCHNPELVLCEEICERTEAENILADLKRRAPFLDGVCVTGGEPTLQSGLIPFLKKIRLLGLKVKLDTNGALPEVLGQLLSEELLDYVAMDVKAPWAKYPRAGGWTGDISRIAESISLLLDSSLSFEFRTTLVPGIHEPDDAPSLGRMTEGAPLYILQNFRPGKTLDPAFSSGEPFSEKFLEDFREALRPFVQSVRIRA